MDLKLSDELDSRTGKLQQNILQKVDDQLQDIRKKYALLSEE